jgi:hypothetical protein
MRKLLILLLLFACFKSYGQDLTAVHDAREKQIEDNYKLALKNLFNSIAEPNPIHVGQAYSACDGWPGAGYKCVKHKMQCCDKGCGNEYSYEMKFLTGNYNQEIAANDADYESKRAQAEKKAEAEQNEKDRQEKAKAEKDERDAKIKATKKTHDAAVARQAGQTDADAQSLINKAQTATDPTTQAMYLQQAKIKLTYEQTHGNNTQAVQQLKAQIAELDKQQSAQNQQKLQNSLNSGYGTPVDETQNLMDLMNKNSDLEGQKSANKEDVKRSMNDFFNKVKFKDDSIRKKDSVKIKPKKKP